MYTSFSDEIRTCAEPNTLSKHCGSQWSRAIPTCCPTLVCEAKKWVLLTAPTPYPTPTLSSLPTGTELPTVTFSPVTCAIENQKSTGYGAKKGENACCAGLVCHEFQYWRCVRDENKSCAGPNTLARQCGSQWNRATLECCPGLVCEDRNCVPPKVPTLYPTPTKSTLPTSTLYPSHFASTLLPTNI